MRHRALRPDFAFCCVADRRTASQVIVELGSGVSTIINAYRLEALWREGRRFGHDAAFAAQTRRTAPACLREWATVYHEPLGELRVGGAFTNGDLTLFGPAAIDLLIVDGPNPGEAGCTLSGLPLQ
jgi:hypothetical protein